MKRTLWWASIFLALGAFLWGCERSPEDLEAWRNAEGGYEKLAEWAKSSEEPMPVRIRAVQMLIEEGQPNILQMIFEDIDDEKTRAQIANGAVSTVEELWKKQDMPTMAEAEKGRVKVGESDAVNAKDAAFFLQPYATGEAQKKLENILAEWMSKDQDLRTKIGATTVGQVAPRAGEGAADALIAWFSETKKPATVARIIRKDADDEIRGKLAEEVRRRAEEAHPELDEQLEVVVLETKHEAIVPYLEMAIMDPEAPPKLIDAAMDALVNAQAEKSTPFFAKVVREKSGLLRWVAAQRLVELRGKAGVLVAANALPLEMETYPPTDKEDLKKNSEVFCNFVDTEMKKLEVESIADVLKRGLKSSRWPTQFVSLQCAKTTNASDVKEQVEALTSSDQQLPGWGEKKTIGELATEIAAEL